MEYDLKEIKRRMKECCGPYNKLATTVKQEAERLLLEMERDPSHNVFQKLEAITAYQAHGPKMERLKSLGITI